MTLYLTADIFSRPLETHECVIIAAACLAFIFLLIISARRRSAKIAREFRAKHPDAALLCLYVRDSSRTDGRITCSEGIISKLFDSKDAPESGLKHCAACHVVPGQTKLDVTVNFVSANSTRHGSMRAHFSFTAEPNHSYAALFDPENGGAKLCGLSAVQGNIDGGKSQLESMSTDFDRGNSPRTFAPVDTDGNTYDEIPDCTVQPLDPTTPTQKFTGSVILIFLPFIGMFFGFALLWLAVSPWLVELLVGGAKTPYELLQACRGWYKTIITAVIIAVVMPIAGAVASVKRGVSLFGILKLIAVCTVFPLFVGGAMIVEEDVVGLISRTSADIEQCESDSLSRATVWLSPNIQKTRLPGPYSEGQPQPLTLYGGVGDDTMYEWAEFYIPDCLGFSLGQDARFDINKSLEWNRANARQYRLYYTDNLRVVVSIEPVESSEADPRSE